MTFLWCGENWELNNPDINGIALLSSPFFLLPLNFLIIESSFLSPWVASQRMFTLCSYIAQWQYAPLASDPFAQIEKMKWEKHMLSTVYPDSKRDQGEVLGGHHFLSSIIFELDLIKKVQGKSVGHWEVIQGRRCIIISSIQRLSCHFWFNDL